MSDQIKHSPINIPIVSGDDDVETEASDVIEIDGDDLEYDPNELLESDSAEFDSDPVDSAHESDPPASSTDSVADSGGPTLSGDRENGDAVAVVESTDVDDVNSTDAEVDDAGGTTVGEEMTAVSKQAVIDLMTELRQKSESITKLSDERSDLYDRLLRKQAEFENFRKRGEREMQEAYVRARADLLLDLLPVLDNLDLAVQHADTTNPDAVREGVHLIHKQLFDSLYRLGLEPIEADGQPFDPELHEAVATEPTEEVPDHTVLVVLQRGYKLADRMLRPARVKVAVTP